MIKSKKQETVVRNAACAQRDIKSACAPRRWQRR